MLSYSSEQLRSFDHDRPPMRGVRKALFARRLWNHKSQKRVCSARAVSRDHCLQNTAAVATGLNVGWLNVRALTGKTHAVHEVIVDKQLDVAILCETWHRSTDDLCLRRAAPENYSVVDAVRPSDPAHGGIAIYYRGDYTCARVAIPSVSTFECLCVRIGAPGGSRIFLAV